MLAQKKLSKSVAAIDINSNKIIKIYDSITQASKDICEEGKNPRAIANHISKAKDTNKQAHGFYWKTKLTLPNIDELKGDN